MDVPPRRSRILIVDDSWTIRAYLEELLKGDFDCQAFAEGPSALEAALARPPDLILSDVVMEPYGGYELCRLVREQPTLRDIPLVLLTSNDDVDGRALGLEKGADDYLAKPVRARELLARVRSLLRLRQAQQQILAQQARLEASNHRLLQTQAELLSAEKLATLGTLAAGVAHEVNNPLSFVVSGVKQLVDAVDALVKPSTDASEREQVVRDVAEIQDEVLLGLNRIRSIVKDLGRFATRPESAPGSLDIAQEVESAMVASAPKMGAIEVRRQLEHTSTVFAAPGYISQIVQTLLSNAVDGLKGRPAPRITVASADVPGGVEVRISDNGLGMEESVRQRLFEPFFTTKSAGQGAGLGLSICQSLLNRLGGSIDCTSEVGKGSSFRFVVMLRPPDSAAVFNRAQKTLKAV